MSQNVLLDTGPLVAAINHRDNYHQWAIATWDHLTRPLITCEAVITEACFLLQDTYPGSDAVLTLMNRGILNIPFHLEEESIAIKTLMNRYQSVPMSLADACLVRMAESYKNSFVMTLDSDFQIYRMNRNQTIPLMMPDRL